MKKILVVDWLDKYAGSERVINSLHKVLKFDECYTLVNIMSKQDLNKTFNGNIPKINHTLLNLFGKKFRYFLLLFPYFTKCIKLPKNTELIISSSHAISKYITSTNALHISYFQARNLKYIWEEQNLYFTGIKKIFKFIIPYLQKFDLDASKKPNFIISNSKFVQSWVKRTYDRNSIVIYPPVDVDSFKLETKKESYYVSVGRLEPYKRFDIIVKAFNELEDKKLIIIGDGSQRRYLQSISKSNIEFVGFLDKEVVSDYVGKSKAFVFVAEEDFGIAPVEAQACGTPVICLGKGGAKETIVDMQTGVHFAEQNMDDLLNAIKKFESNADKFDPVIIRQNALRFSKERFEKEIKEYVEQKYMEFKEGLK